MAYKSRFALAAIVFGFALAICAQDSKACVVIDAETGQPIPDAIVLVRWRGIRSDFGHASSECRHVATARADTKGEFQAPIWLGRFGPLEMLLTSQLHAEVEAFSPGYVSSRAASDANKILLSRFTGSDREYANYLHDLQERAHCHYNDDEANKQALKPYVDAVASAVRSYPAYVPPRSVCIGCGQQYKVEPIPKPMDAD